MGMVNKEKIREMGWEAAVVGLVVSRQHSCEMACWVTSGGVACGRVCVKEA